jgi:uncharacterized membrane protein
MPRTNPRIFISYRRADSAAIVGHLYERLVAHYSGDCVFRDIDDIPLGVNFYDHVKHELAGCDVALIVIGPEWVDARGRDTPRIMRDDDPVRIEVETALASGAYVIPVLVQGAAMPSAESLPPSLLRLLALNAASLNPGKEFEQQLSGLLRNLDQALLDRGKPIIHLPAWLGPAAIGGVTLALSPFLMFGASAVFRIRLPSFASTASIMLTSLCGALAFSLLGTSMIAKQRIAVFWLRARPWSTGVVLYLLSFPVLYFGATALVRVIPVDDAVHVAKSLRSAFAAAIEARDRTGREDFSVPLKLVNELRSMDPDSGYAWYYAGEIARASNASLFNEKGCARTMRSGKAVNLDPFERDFFRYLEIAREKDAQQSEMDWSQDACYDTSDGFCLQRTAWVYHLLAIDEYRKAMAVRDETRAAFLRDARDYVRQDLRFPRPEGGSGFIQCMESSVLLAKIDAGLGVRDPVSHQGRRRTP